MVPYEYWKLVWPAILRHLPHIRRADREDLIRTMNFSDLGFKLRVVLDWDDARTTNAINRYRDFLILVAFIPEADVIPLDWEVEYVWLAHQSDVDTYSSQMYLNVGKVPYPLRDEWVVNDVPSGRFVAAKQTTRRAYIEYFGSEPPELDFSPPVAYEMTAENIGFDISGPYI